MIAAKPAYAFRRIEECLIVDRSDGYIERTVILYINPDGPDRTVESGNPAMIWFDPHRPETLTFSGRVATHNQTEYDIYRESTDGLESILGKTPYSVSGRDYYVPRLQ